MAEDDGGLPARPGAAGDDPGPGRRRDRTDQAGPADAGLAPGRGLPHAVIATKHDKVKASKRDKRKKDLAEACLLHPADIVWVSAAKGTGIDRLRGLVREWLR